MYFDRGIEQYLKGYVGSQWTVFAIKLNTQCQDSYSVVPPYDIYTWTFTLYWQLNSGGWTSIQSWQCYSYGIMANPPSWRLEFSKVLIDSIPHTQANGYANGYDFHGAHDFGALYFSSPSVEQVFCKADQDGSIQTQFDGSRSGDILLYG